MRLRQVNEIATFKPTISFHEGDISYARQGPPLPAGHMIVS